MDALGDLIGVEHFVSKCLNFVSVQNCNQRSFRRAGTLVVGFVDDTCVGHAASG